MKKDLAEKAIDIKGKKYVLVSDRVLYFNETYSTGSITTELVSDPNADLVVVKATVMPDATVPDRKFTGYSQATWDDGYINKTAAMENAETSAVGRALAFMGIGVIESIASADELQKAVTQRPWKPTGPIVSKPTHPDQFGWKEPKHKDVGRDSAEHDAGQVDFGEGQTTEL